MRAAAGICGVLIVATFGLGSPPAVADVATEESGGLGAPDAQTVGAARRAPLVRYHRAIPGGAYTNMGNSGGGAVIMAYAALAGDMSVDGRLLEQIRYTLTGGNDIAANGGYPAQHELQVTSMFAIVKNIPRIWGQLTSAEVERADAMMRASMVAGAFTTSDNNPYVLARDRERTLDADFNVGRGWNPNYREGMGGSVLVAAAYLGVERAKEFLQHYEHDSFAAHLCEIGLDNSCATFNWKRDNPASEAPTGEQIESVVHDWSLWGVPLDDIMGLARDLAFRTYGATVGCGLNDGQGVPAPNAPDGVAGVIHTGCEGLPNVGQPGMLWEFDSVDGGGPRSATYYAFGGLKPNLFVQGALIANGLWRPGELSDEIASLIAVGAEDLWYKLEHGYRNYSIGAYRGTQTINDPGYAFGYIRSLWDDVIAPYHGIIPSPSHVQVMLDRFAADGTIVGTGRGTSGDSRVRAFRRMLQAVAVHIEAQDHERAKAELEAAQKRIHLSGGARPSHFVTGENAGVLHGLLERLRTAIDP
jgi:hypothetical protein